MVVADVAVRIVLDEDVPVDLAEHLRARGIDAIAINELRSTVWPGQTRVTDEEVCAEIAQTPSVLITLNIRDYADVAFMQQLVEVYRVSVVIVRVPKRESGQTKRAQAIHDIVHRNAPRIPRLYGDGPSVASASRRGLRTRRLSEIQALRAASSD